MLPHKHFPPFASAVLIHLAFWLAHLTTRVCFDWSKICLNFQALNSNILFWLTLSKAQISALNSRRCLHTSKRPFSAAKCSAVFFSCGNRQMKIIKTKISEKMTRGKSKKIRVLRAGVEPVTFWLGCSITGNIQDKKSRYSRDVMSAMLVYRTVAKKVLEIWFCYHAN